VKAFEELLKAIDEQAHYLLRTRAVFPYVDPSKLPPGQREFRTAPFYANRGHNVRFVFDSPLTKKEAERISAIGHWINQNYVVRLCSVLEAFDYRTLLAFRRSDTEKASAFR
jgi:hypothetical protein